MDFFYVTSAFIATYFAAVYQCMYSQATSPWLLKKNLGMTGLFFAIYLLLGLLYGFIAPGEGMTALEGVVEITLLFTLFLIAIIDMQEKIIPNTLVVFLLSSRTILLIAQFIQAPDHIKENLFSVIGGLVTGGGIIVLAMILSKNSIGAGDAKMFAAIGYFVGWDVLSVFFFTFMIVAIAGFFLIMLKKVTLKDTVPLAPFAFLGTLLFYLIS